MHNTIKIATSVGAARATIAIGSGPGAPPSCSVTFPEEPEPSARCRRLSALGCIFLSPGLTRSFCACAGAASLFLPRTGKVTMINVRVRVYKREEPAPKLPNLTNNQKTDHKPRILVRIIRIAYWHTESPAASLPRRFLAESAQSVLAHRCPRRARTTIHL